MIDSTLFRVTETEDVVFGLTTDYWGVIIAGIALSLSLFNLWYTVFRKGRPIYACSKWTAIGLDASGQPGATFVLQIGIINNGNKPLILKDFMLIAETVRNKKILYDPIMLFDLTYYIASVGRENRMIESQKGQIPLPLTIPANEQYEFNYEILFMPYDKKTAVHTLSDTPLILKLHALTNRLKSYQLAATQKIDKNDIQNLQNGSFVGVLSTESTKNRDRFIEKLK